jgi:hypothetical protein
MSSSTNQENATDANSLQPSIEENSAATRAVVSPPVYNTTHASGEPSEDVVRDLFSGSNEEIQHQMWHGDVQLLVLLSSRTTEDLVSGQQIMLLESLDYYSLLGLIQAGGRGHWDIINGPNGSMRMLMPFFKQTDLLECSIECLLWFCFDIFQRHRIKQEHSSIADTRTTNQAPSMKIYHRGHYSFFGYSNHSKICLQHPPRLLRLGMKGAVLRLL